MTTHAPMHATPAVVSDPVELDLEARMALTLAVMNERCNLAVLAVDINTAHIPSADPIPEITEVVPLTPTLAPAPYNTPIADLLHQARQRLDRDGWCRDSLIDEQGAICPIRAIRLEASNRRLADDACVFLLDAIQRDFHWADTIPSWNATQPSAAPVLLAFDRAAHLAHARSL